MEGSLPSLCLAGHSDLRDRGQWWQVPAWHSQCVSSGTAPPLQVPRNDRREALQEQWPGQWFTWLGGVAEVGTPQPASIKTASMKKKMCHFHRRLILKETEGPFLMEACCLPGPRLKMWRESLPSSHPGTALGLLSIIDSSGRQQWSCNKQPKDNQERLQGLVTTD